MNSLLDTGYLYGLLDRNDSQHQVIVSASSKVSGKILLPTVVTTEVAYLLLKHLGISALVDFLNMLADELFELVEPTPSDFRRASAIIDQYQDSHLDFVDAVIVAIAERMNITRILTVDQRHFRMFRPKHCVAFDILP